MLESEKNINSIHEQKPLYIKSIKAHDLFDRKNLIHIAITESPSDYDSVAALASAGIDVNKSYYYRILAPPYHQYNSTPIFTAIDLNKLNIVKLLLDNNADIEIVFFNKTPLYRAVENNNIECVALLLSYGADPLHVMQNKDSPLELAIKKEYWDIVELLLDAAVKNKN